jgi:aminopeptidase N
MSEVKEIYLKDYQPSAFTIPSVELHFRIFDGYTLVDSQLNIQRSESDSDSALVLHGQDLDLLQVYVNQIELSAEQYRVDEESLTIENVPDSFQLSICTKIYPEKNTALEGLYRSKRMYCTQCEAEGFRKITYFLDRPDVMSVFTTHIEADAGKCPVLLSNGNCVETKTLDNGRHRASWNDPWPKPSYLFALVAGDLEHIDDRFVTRSGREVLLRIFVEQKDLDKCAHAIESLKNAMRWDEEVYGREYDLDIFMIVAVDDFNMGAMENKGLNIFNTSCVLAKPETTTDAEFQRVEGVVAHEYFHNWSGNRVTCRDWFQLSLKEGFTVFRDSEFSADMGSRTVKRVEDVSLLRSFQFSEDAGPTAHPVQPSSFIEISNFYTLTIYEKGAEIVRMIHTLLGPELFRKGSDLYFDRHDGQAVTIEDFVEAMANVSGRDFSQFMLWYKQAGTPELKMSSSYDADKKQFVLRFQQSCRPTPECENKKPYLIPIEVSLLGTNGPLPLSVSQAMPGAEPTYTVLELNEADQEFVFDNIDEPPVPSVLRGFSAPVNLRANLSSEDLIRIIAHENDGFCRWDASQQLLIEEHGRIKQSILVDPSPKLSSALVNVFQEILSDSRNDPAMLALILSLPSEKYLGELHAKIDVDSVHHARKTLERKLAQSLESNLLDTYKACYSEDAYQAVSADIAKRSLKNKALSYLMILAKDEYIDLCVKQLDEATNMTDELAAFRALVHCPKSSLQELKEEKINAFLGKWKDEALVVNHWFSVQASNPDPDTLERVKSLMGHKAFDFNNPNKLRSLVGMFCSANFVNFHRLDGKGYAFLEEQIIKLNKSNPQIASRFITPLTKWKRFDDTRSQLMESVLKNISTQDGLSKDVFELVNKSLR